jgi:hypothetical protein
MHADVWPGIQKRRQEGGKAGFRKAGDDHPSHGQPGIAQVYERCSRVRLGREAEARLVVCWVIRHMETVLFLDRTRDLTATRPFMHQPG